MVDNSIRIGGLIITGMAGAMCLFSPLGVIYADSEDQRNRRPKYNSPFATSASSQYYESSMAQAGDGLSEPTSLRIEERTHLPGTHTGVYRCDAAQIARNYPECEHTEAVYPVPSGFWSIFAVMEGHNGQSTSSWLRENLALAVVGALADLYFRVYVKEGQTGNPPHSPPEDVATTLKDTFKHLDDVLVYGSVLQILEAESRNAAVNLLSPAYSDSSALLGFYDSHSRMLHTALTGDSRAVLGRRTRDGKGDVVYQVHVLSVEQDGSNLAEEHRLNALHPGEVVVHNGRAISGGPMRSFGGAMYKWDQAIRRRLEEASPGQPTLPHVKTPPYLTAEPEVTSIRVNPGDFVILATRGMWDRLTSDEAVGLIGMWLDKQWRQQGVVAAHKQPTRELKDFLADPPHTAAETVALEIEERNAATHLLRNALYGEALTTHSGQQADKTLSFSTIRDGATATVVFFAEEQAQQSDFE